MKYSVIVLACVLAVAAAQFNNGQYVPEKEKQNFYNYNNQYKYNQQYNNQQYNPYNRFQNNRYRPFGSTTLAPRPYYFSSTTAAPARATFAPFKSLQPLAPVSSIAPPASSAAPAAPAASASPAPAASPAPVASPAPAASPTPSASPAPVKPLFNVYPSAVPVSKYYSDAANAGIVSYENDISPDGAFKYSFQTSNGIAAQEEGVPRSFYSGENAVAPVVSQGSFAWSSPEGKDIAITYIADENGYQPSGDAIPKAPEIPALIARALEFIARNVKSSAE